MDTHLRMVASPFSRARANPARFKNAQSEFTAYATEADRFDAGNRHGSGLTKNSSEGGADTRLRLLREIQENRRAHYERRFDRSTPWFACDTISLPGSHALSESPAVRREQLKNAVHWTMRNFPDAHLGSVPPEVSEASENSLLLASRRQLAKIHNALQAPSVFARPSGAFAGTIGTTQARRDDAAIGISKDGRIIVKYPTKKSVRRNAAAVQAFAKLLIKNESDPAGRLGTRPPD